MWHWGPAAQGLDMSNSNSAHVFSVALRIDSLRTTVGHEALTFAGASRCSPRAARLPSSHRTCGVGLELLGTSPVCSSRTRITLISILRIMSMSLEYPPLRVEVYRLNLK